MGQISYDIIFVDSNDSYVPYECGVLERLPLTDDTFVELQPGKSLQVNQDSSCWALPPENIPSMPSITSSPGKALQNLIG